MPYSIQEYFLKLHFTMLNWLSHITAFERYLLYERIYSRHTVKAYISDAQSLADYCKRNMKISTLIEVTGDLLRKFLKYLNRKGISAASQARHLTGLRAFFNYLIQEDLIYENPVLQIDAPKAISKLPKIFDIKEIEKMLDFLSKPNIQHRRTRAMISLIYSSGLRVSELLNFKWSNYHYKKGYIKVLGKGNKERLIPIGYHAILHINKYIIKDRAAQGAHSAAQLDYLFLTDHGKRFTQTQFRYVLKKTAEAVGITRHITPRSKI